MKPTNTIAGMIRELEKRGARFEVRRDGMIRTTDCACPIEALTGKTLAQSGDVTMRWKWWRIRNVIRGADMTGEDSYYRPRARRMLLRLVKP